MTKTSTVIFNVSARTLFGEQVYVTGNCKALGNWDPDQALLLRTDSQSFPMWSISAALESHTNIEYKYFTRDLEMGKPNWELFIANRKLYITSLWSLVDDGRFGTLKEDRREVITSSNYEATASEHIDISPSNFDTVSKMQKYQEDMEVYRMIITDLERKVLTLQGNIAMLEGQHLKSLTIEQLKELASKSRKTADQASEYMMKKMEEEADNKTNVHECVACMDRKIDTIFLPCAHLIVCHECAPKLSGKCPLCKVKIDSIHKVFMK